MLKDSDILDFCVLICRTLEGSETAERVAYLDRMLRDDPEVLGLYNFITEVHAQLMCPGQSSSISSMQDNSKGKLELKILEMLLDEELHAPTFDIPKPVVEIEPASVVRIERPVEKRFSRWGIVASMAAVALICVSVYFNQDAVAVATLRDSYQVKWKTNALKDEQRLFRGDEPLELFSGCVKVEFDNGAEVVIEGPASFSLQSPEQMKLFHGRLSSLVPAQAAGFRVDTPNMTVADLGTEFTLEVDLDGTGVVNLYTGSALVMAGHEGGRLGTSMLTPGQAKKVDKTGKMSEEEFDKTRIVRSFDSQNGFVWHGQYVDLAAVIAGADLFSPLKGLHGIDPLTGANVSGYRYLMRNSSGKYIKAEANKYVDGVFIPDGDLGDNVITSEGHIFRDCPGTAGVRGYDGAGQNSHDILVFCDYDVSEVRLQENQLPIFKEVNAGTAGFPAVLVHSNAGITFDLDSIRKDISGLLIKSFQTSFGLPDIDELMYADACVTVMVDGEPRYIEKNLKQEDGLMSMVIDISPKDRFLTIAVTDNQESAGEKGAIDNDYVYLVSPRLDVAVSY
ncbi:MAG: FecR domain-containing protein [Sedimentisphaerales bacterium]|nr:FecR domain-containing protein [Sedimentisphaerales bacterium]MBN2842293.1 FecR domain-containing protein [Sedimentisphaerales bacterium]